MNDSLRAPTPQFNEHNVLKSFLEVPFYFYGHALSRNIFKTFMFNYFTAKIMKIGILLQKGFQPISYASGECSMKADGYYFSCTVQYDY